MKQGAKLPKSKEQELIEFLKDEHGYSTHSAERLVDENYDKIAEMYDDGADFSDIVREISAASDGAKINSIEQHKVLTKRFKDAINKYFERGIKDFSDDKEMIVMFNRDKKQLESVLDVFKKSPKKAYKKAESIFDTAVREVIPPSVWIAMRKESMEDGGKISGKSFFDKFFNK